MHEALCKGLGRPDLRPPAGDDIVVEFFDRPAYDGLDEVNRIVEEYFDSPQWLQAGRGLGNARFICGPYPV